MMIIQLVQWSTSWRILKIFLKLNWCLHLIIFLLDPIPSKDYFAACYWVFWQSLCLPDYWKLTIMVAYNITEIAVIYVNKSVPNIPMAFLESHKKWSCSLAVSAETQDNSWQHLHFLHSCLASIGNLMLEIFIFLYLCRCCVIVPML